MALGVPNYAVATATRGAMMAMVAPLAVELAPRRIRVNAILPGAIETPAFAKLGLSPEQLASFGAWIQPRLLVGRTGTSEDVARVVAFLVSPAAAYVNGTLPADRWWDVRRLIGVCRAGVVARVVDPGRCGVNRCFTRVPWQILDPATDVPLRK